MLADGAWRQTARPGHGRQDERIAEDKPGSTDPQSGRAHKGPGLGLLQDERQANGVNGRKYQQEEAAPYRIRRHDGHARRGKVPATGHPEQRSAESQRLQARAERMKDMQQQQQPREGGSAGSVMDVSEPEGGRNNEAPGTKSTPGGGWPAAELISCRPLSRAGAQRQRARGAGGAAAG